MPVHTFFEIKLPVLEIKVLVNKCLKVTFMAGKTEKKWGLLRGMIYVYYGILSSWYENEVDWCANCERFS